MRKQEGSAKQLVNASILGSQIQAKSKINWAPQTWINFQNRMYSTFAESWTNSRINFLSYPTLCLFGKGAASSSTSKEEAVLLRAWLGQGYQPAPSSGSSQPAETLTKSSSTKQKASRPFSPSPKSFVTVFMGTFISFIRIKLTEQASSNRLEHREDREEVKCCVNAFKSIGLS